MHLAARWTYDNEGVERGVCLLDSPAPFASDDMMCFFVICVANARERMEHACNGTESAAAEIDISTSFDESTVCALYVLFRTDECFGSAQLSAIQQRPSLSQRRISGESVANEISISSDSVSNQW